MNLNVNHVWEIAAGAIIIAGAAIVVARRSRRQKPSELEIEYNRRLAITQDGRLVDGTLLDVTEVADKDGQPVTYLFYEYRIGGVDYECSQDITHMGSTLDPAQIRSGFPCTVRYQPGNPKNSIVVAERWSGLRASLPTYPGTDDRWLRDPRVPRPN